MARGLQSARLRLQCERDKTAPVAPVQVKSGPVDLFFGSLGLLMDHGVMRLPPAMWARLGRLEAP